jgi:arylsulfatase A-like enzyme
MNNSAAKRPNIVIFQCDQMRVFETGLLSHPVVKTPNISKLAEGGCVMDQAVCNSPICVPSRSSLLSGQYARTCTGRLSNWKNKSRFGERLVLKNETLPEVLRADGYRTSLIGKWHIAVKPDLVGFDECTYPAEPHRNNNQDYFIGNEKIRTEGFGPDFEIDRAGEFVQNNSDRPFFLHFNVSPPHFPFNDMPESYIHQYAPDEAVLRANAEMACDRESQDFWFRTYMWGAAFRLEKQQLPMPEGFNLRALTAMYYGMIKCVDDYVGKMTELLRRFGLLENTLFVFLSDHGDNLGSHCLFNKMRCTEESIRIPLVFSWPGQIPTSANSEQMISTIDVMPTVLGLLGMTAPEGVQGRDLSAVIRGECVTSGDNHAIIESIAGDRCIRTPSMKYNRMEQDGLWEWEDYLQYCGVRTYRDAVDDAVQLFDLTRDPYEMQNMAGSREYRELEQTLKEKLDQWETETGWNDYTTTDVQLYARQKMSVDN